jgi:beta-phosphoglucomutase-like phosphatase (HAD superfamily)
MKIQAVIFDMDGVLIDAKDWHYEALNRALNLFGYNISLNDHLSSFDGLPTIKKLEILSRDYDFPDSLHTFINDLKQLYIMELVNARCKPTFQHEFALSRLRVKGYKLAVASNSRRDTVATMMGKSNLTQYLDFFLSNEDVKYGKPEPDIYLEAAYKFGLRPSECLVLEDNQNGILAAEKAGCSIMVINSVLDVSLERIEKKIQEIGADDN